MRRRFRIQNLMLLIVILALAFAGLDKARRLASVCYIQGEVMNPGGIETFGRKLTVIDALKESGGLVPRPDRVDVRLVRHSRGRQQTLTVDLDNPTTSLALKPGDRLIVYRGGVR